MDTEVLLEIKPKYVGYIRFFYNIVISFLAILCVAMVDWLIPMLMNLPEPQLWYVYIAINILLWLWLTGFLMFLDRKNYQVTNYKVYNDRIEFEEGFINHKCTTIKICDVKEIHWTQNFLQRFANLATIRFVTPANNSATFSGVTFMDIENSKYIYAKLKQIQENKDA